MNWYSKSKWWRTSKYRDISLKEKEIMLWSKLKTLNFKNFLTDFLLEFLKKEFYLLTFLKRKLLRMFPRIYWGIITTNVFYGEKMFFIQVFQVLRLLWSAISTACAKWRVIMVGSTHYLKKQKMSACILWRLHQCVILGFSSGGLW